MGLEEHMLTIHCLSSASSNKFHPSNKLWVEIRYLIRSPECRTCFHNGLCQTDSKWDCVLLLNKQVNAIISTLWKKIITLDRYHRKEDGMACIPLNLLEEAILGRR